jgi:competence protein ComFC
LYHDATLISIFNESSILCLDCQKKLTSKKIRFQLDNVEIVSFHVYDEHISKLLILYKEHLDEALSPIFFDKYKKQINKKYKGYVCIPLPSSSEKVAQRGFHHLHRMIESLDLAVADVLVKTKNVKQARLSKEERKHIDMIFEIKENSECSFDKVVLIDDVCTTGASLKAAITLLRPHCKQLCAITFAYHPLWKTEGVR